MILLAYGTRPEWIKILPVINELKKRNTAFRILFTGQHETLSEGYFDKRIIINKGDNRLDDIVSALLSNIGPSFSGVDKVLVQGDTASAFAVGVAAFHRRLELFHLEAGLRTYDRSHPYPEESYRQMLSRISSVHLCPTQHEANILVSEKTEGRIVVVGNTVLDHLVHLKPEYGNYVLITMHRRENHALMAGWFAAINKCAAATGLKFLLPIHPNPDVMKWKHLLTDVDVVKPMSHANMIEKLAGCRFVITDSGGLQEEGSFLNKKVVVCRKTTERNLSLGTHSFLCPEPESLLGIVEDISKNFKISAPCPYGDGYSSNRVVDSLIL